MQFFEMFHLDVFDIKEPINTEMQIRQDMYQTFINYAEIVQYLIKVLKRTYGNVKDIYGKQNKNLHFLSRCFCGDGVGSGK
jgi:hypothetical protein